MLLDWLKKIAYWIFAGAIFGTAATVAGLYTLKYWSYQKMNAPSEYELYQKDHEAKIGKSCDEVYDEAMKFVEISVKPIIEAGRAGKDWLSLINEEMLSNMKELDEKGFMCSIPMIKSKDDEERVKGKKLKSFSMLYFTLNSHTISYTKDPVKITDLKPGAFEAAEKDYLDVTK